MFAFLCVSAPGKKTQKYELRYGGVAGPPPHVVVFVCSVWGGSGISCFWGLFWGTSATVANLVRASQNKSNNNQIRSGVTVPRPDTVFLFFLGRSGYVFSFLTPQLIWAISDKMTKFAEASPQTAKNTKI